MRFFSKIVPAFTASLLLSLLTAGAETVVWSDNFETGAGSRWTTNSVWQIGSPTIGPATNASGFRTYSGSRCATTGLTKGAASNVDGRLICTNYNGSKFLTIPPAGQSPRLRFWQWFDFVNGGGAVEARVMGTTNWQAISITNSSSAGSPYVSSGVWSRPSLDLSAFAGTNVQFAFHFISGGNFGTDPGWYVDDVAVVTGQPALAGPDGDGFEAGLGDWAVTSGTWEVGIPTTGPPTNSAGFRAHTGTNCAATVLTGNYGALVDTRLISPPFTVPASGDRFLRFSQWYDFVNAGGFVEVSVGTATTNSISMTNIVTSTNFVVNTNIFINIDSNSIPPVSTTNITFTTNPIVTPVSTNISTTVTISTNSWQSISPFYDSPNANHLTSNGQWTNTTLDLSPFSGKTLQVAFHFGSGGAMYGSAAGWYIDDIAFGDAPLLMVPDTKTIIKGQLFTAAATATNSSLPNSHFTFGFAAPSTNASISSGGTINWTNTKPKIGTNLLAIMVTDDRVPPSSVTKNFNVIVWPAFQFSASNTLASKKYFLLTLQTATNRTWRIDASTNLMTWKPVFTNLVPPSGLLQFTDRLATNFPTRFYRAVYP